MLQSYVFIIQTQLLKQKPYTAFPALALVWAKHIKHNDWKYRILIQYNP